MAEDHKQQVSQIQDDIIRLQAAIESLSGIPEAQQGLLDQLAEKQQLLMVLQTGGNNLGVGNIIGQVNDIIGRDKVSIDISTGPIVIGKSAHNNEQRQHIRYLQALSAQLYHLPLRGL